jgi:uncharacterized protein (TIGR01777 family)
MIIAISGSSGFIGSYLKKKFDAFASEVIVLKRDENNDTWKRALQRADVIINLAGSPVFTRWNTKNRLRILESRVLTTRRIVSVLNDLPEEIEPKLLISASATGIYPDDKFTQYNEYSTEKGSGFLAEVVSKWEAEADNLINPSVRLVIARLGVVIGKNGGSLSKMIPVFRLGLGGVIGSGKQMTCFIHIEDIFNAFLFFIKNKNTSGLYNLVSPHPISSREFSQTLARALHRPLLFRIPGFVLKMLYGQASCIMLNGANIYPHKLLDQGFKFTYPELKEAMQEVVS